MLTDLLNWSDAHMQSGAKTPFAALCSLLDCCVYVVKLLVASSTSGIDVQVSSTLTRQWLFSGVGGLAGSC